jgi:hypothetical protein
MRLVESFKSIIDSLLLLIKNYQVKVLKKKSKMNNPFKSLKICITLKEETGKSFRRITIKTQETMEGTLSISLRLIESN